MNHEHIKRYEVTITGFFDEDAEKDTFRVGYVTNVEFVGEVDSESGDIIKVDAIVGDTATHKPLRERAEVKSSTVDMSKETGCSEASISTTVAPGGGGYPDLNGVIIGAKASETEDDPNTATTSESKREEIKLLSDIGKAVIEAMRRSLPELRKGFTVVVSSKELKEVAEGDYYENITVDNPDSSAE